MQTPAGAAEAAGMLDRVFVGTPDGEVAEERPSGAGPMTEEEIDALASEVP
jgi:hypothetical protein